MSKSYSYVVDHDTGFAPMIHSNTLCTLSGCKKTTVEKWAKKGSWILGTGGLKTGANGKIIYLMEVAMNHPIDAFRSRFPEQSKYLEGKDAHYILESKNFYYFGDRAIDLPAELKHLHRAGRGCKCFSEADKDRLIKHIQSMGFVAGRIGEPNNPSSVEKSVKRRC